MYQKSCMLSLSISLWASKAPGFYNLCYLESILRFIKNKLLIFCGGMYNAKKWVPWSSTLVVQDSLTALDIGVSLCLQLNQSILHSQQAEIQSAAVAVCRCSVQQIAQMFNVHIQPCASGVKHLQMLLYLYFMYKYYLFPDSYCLAVFPETFSQQINITFLLLIRL